MSRTAWQSATVGELAAPKRNALVGGPFGSNLVSADYVDEGVPVIRGQNMGHGRWVEGEFAFVSSQKAEDLSANLAVPGDLVFTQRGTLGQVALVPRGAYDRYIISQSQMKLSVNEAIACPLFLYYFFNSPEQIDYIKLTSIQTGVPHTNLGLLRSTQVRLPSLEEQHSIARVLGSLDDKIELNRRMNQTLEAMARAIFKSWFVNFEPALAEESSRIFPDFGTTPQGWEVKPLDSIAEFLNGLALQKFPPSDDGSMPVIKIADLRRGNTESSDRAGLDVPDDYVVEDGTVLFSWSGTLEVVVWTGGRGALNQHIFKVSSTSYPKWFYFYWLKEHLPSFRSIAADKATTMGHIQRRHLTQAMVVAPPPNVLQTMDQTMAPLLEKQIQNDLESKILASLRDTLLPKLLSGEIRVKQAERALAEVV